MMIPTTRLPPPPMPKVREAQYDVREAHAALERGMKAWNPSQLEDALRSAKDFIAKAERALQ